MFFIQVNGELDGAIHAFQRLPYRLDEAKKEFADARPAEELNSKINRFKTMAEKINTAIKKLKNEICDYEDFIFEEAKNM